MVGYYAIGVCTSMAYTQIMSVVKRTLPGPMTSCHVETDPVVGEDGKEADEHTFFINVHNNTLKTEMKFSKQDSRLLEAKFKYANVLLGLAMLPDDDQRSETSDAGSDESRIEDKIRGGSEAVAPVLLPMIDQLSGLDESELEDLSLSDSDQQ